MKTSALRLAPAAARSALLCALALSLSACLTVPYAEAPPGSHVMRLPEGGVGPRSPLPSGMPAEPLIDEGQAPLQCEPFARALSGVDIYGDAHTWWAQSDGRFARSRTPMAGSVLVLRGYNDAGRGHVAVVTAVLSAREILVDQANWMNGGEITRRVPVRDVSPGNDWSAVNVWWIPSSAWGRRVFEAEGFIHPARQAWPST
jgi:hypothetical protein